MSKKIVGADGECLSSVRTVKGVTPCGSQVLVEILTPQELMNTNITISEKTDLKVPLQGYIGQLAQLLVQNGVIRLVIEF